MKPKKRALSPTLSSLLYVNNLYCSDLHSAH